MKVVPYWRYRLTEEGEKKLGALDEKIERAGSGTREQFRLWRALATISDLPYDVGDQPIGNKKYALDETMLRRVVALGYAEPRSLEETYQSLQRVLSSIDLDAARMLEVYKRVAYAEDVSESELDTALVTAKAALSHLVGQGDAWERRVADSIDLSMGQGKQWYEQVDKLDERISNAQSRTDKVLALDAVVHLMHMSGPVIGGSSASYHPEYERMSGLYEKVLDAWSEE